MFKQWRNKSAKTDRKQEQSVALIPQDIGNTIIFFHHERDQELWYDLAQHLDTLMVRFPDLFQWKFYYYRMNPKQGEDKHESFMSDLEQACLYVPCTSVPFLSNFWRICQKDARLVPLLAQRFIQPIPLRAAHGVEQTLLPHPLAAYPAGHLRDEACVQIVSALQQQLQRFLKRRQTEVQTPVTLAETSPQLLLTSPR